jgi:hypothetical protein
MTAFTRAVVVCTRGYISTRWVVPHRPTDVGPVPFRLPPFCFFISFKCLSLATIFVVVDVCIISDDISFKRFSATNFNSYLRRHILLLISINSDDIKGRRYLVFSDGLIATTRSDGHSRR